MKDGEKVILHSATGDDFEVPLLKQLALDTGWKNSSAMVAMSKVKKHNDSLECYACHASWVPNCLRGSGTPMLWWADSHAAVDWQ